MSVLGKFTEGWEARRRTADQSVQHHRAFPLSTRKQAMQLQLAIYSKSSGQSPRRPPLPLKGLESSALQALSTASCLSPMYYRHFLFSSEVHLIAMLVMDELSLQQRILPARLCLCNSDLGSEDMILKWVSQG
jgi:hypothetical protein